MTKKIIFILVLIIFVSSLVYAAQNPPLRVNVEQLLKGQSLSNSVNLILTLAAISLVPFFLMSTSSFLRLIIVLGMMRSAIGTQQVPPAPIIISLAIFMTIYIMTPVYVRVYEDAVIPYNKGRISQQTAFKRGIIPVREFMIRQTREKDLALFVQFANIKPPKKIDDLPTHVIIPAFLISELKTAFQIGFVIFLPFVVIDMIVASILLSLGMFMLSPVLVSLPFKILLFVLTDGWFIITRGLMQSFHV